MQTNKISKHELLIEADMSGQMQTIKVQLDGNIIIAIDEPELFRFKFANVDTLLSYIESKENDRQELFKRFADYTRSQEAEMRMEEEKRIWHIRQQNISEGEMGIDGIER